VNSEYILAAGSALARKPTNFGGVSNFDTCSVISSINFFAIVAARTTPVELVSYR